MRILSIVFILITNLSLCISAQQNIVIKGQVYDQKEKTPLPFATVIPNGETTRGIMTDINGKFTVKLKKSDQYLNVSFVGYKPQNLKVSSLLVKKKNKIYLESTVHALGEVVVKASENPAHKIIRNAVKYAKENNPDKKERYSCKLYNKMLFNFVPKHDSVKFLNRVIEDTTSLFLMESIAQKNYVRPNKVKEKIVSLKVSGFRDPSFGTLTSDIQPFHFYDENYAIAKKDYLNPISKGSEKKYIFIIQDTLYSGQDSVFVIKYFPRRDKTFDGLHGVLHINSNKFAVQKVWAKPFEKTLTNLSTYIESQFVNGEWFPKKVKYQMFYENFPRKDLKMVVDVETYIYNADKKLTIKENEFDEETALIAEDAAQIGKEKFDSIRPIPLTQRDIDAVADIDSVGNAYGFDNKLRIVERLVDRRFPIWKFDIYTPMLYMNNKAEKNKFGFGLLTSRDLSNKFSLGGFGAYSTGLEKWSYGGMFEWYFDQYKENKLGFIATKDALMPCRPLSTIHNDYFRYFQMTRADFANERKLYGAFRKKYLHLYFEVAKRKMTPQYNYEFLSNNGKTYKSYNLSEATVKLRYSPKEKFITVLKRKRSYQRPFPVFTVTYTKGIDKFGGDFKYDRLEGKIDFNFHIKSLGRTWMSAEVGKVWGDVPYSRYFTPNGSKISKMPMVFKNSFNTMELLEFTSDQYFAFYFYHDFGSLLFKTNTLSKYFRPTIALVQNVAFGTYSDNLSKHKGIEFKDMNKGYYETGVVVRDIIRYEFYSIIHIGAGAGIYHNYGTYNDSKKFMDNTVIKGALSLTF